jgi:hypothetical protein
MKMPLMYQPSFVFNFKEKSIILLLKKQKDNKSPLQKLSMFLLLRAIKLIYCFLKKSKDRKAFLCKFFFHFLRVIKSFYYYKKKIKIDFPHFSFNVN